MSNLKVLVRGGEFATEYSSSHVLDKDGFTLWEVKILEEENDFEIIGCIESNIFEDDVIENEVEYDLEEKELFEQLGLTGLI